MGTGRSKELWDRLDNEPERAHRAFQTFLNLPRDERTIVEAYRSHIGNPEAIKPSDTWTRWSRDFAWSERASAYDDHLESVRRDAYERGIEEEAERQGVLAERIRNRTNELMTRGYEESVRWFEEVGASGMRASDAIQVIKLHLDAVKTFGVQEPRADDDWTEEDDAEFAEMMKEMEAEEASEEGSSEGLGEAEERPDESDDQSTP